MDAGAAAAERYFRNRQGKFGDAPNHSNDNSNGNSNSSGGNSNVPLDLTAGMRRSQSLESGVRAGSSGFSVSKAQAAQVVGSVQQLLQEHAAVSDIAERLQKVLKKFFKFQIEEDEMKAQVTEVL